MKKIYLVRTPELADEHAYLCIYREYADDVVEFTPIEAHADIKVFPCSEPVARKWKYRFLYVTNQNMFPPDLKIHTSRTFW